MADTVPLSIIAGALEKSRTPAAKPEKFDHMAALEEAEQDYLDAFEKKDRKAMARARLAAHRIAATMED